MKLELINIDQISEPLSEITNPKIFENGKFSKTGLFSQQIFGPIKSNQCACKELRGIKNVGRRCEKCGVKVMSSNQRRKIYAKIKLPFPILNPIFYFLMGKLKSSSTKILDSLLNYSKDYYIDESNEIKLLDEESKNLLRDLLNTIKKDSLLKGMDGVKKYIKKIIEERKDDSDIAKFLDKHIEQIEISNILVMPPGFRPCNQNSSEKWISDEINKIYVNIITRCSHIYNIPVEFTENDDIYKTNFKHLYALVLELYNHIFTKLSKKQGLIRSNILGKRVDFSGRAVISPNPELNLDECKIPYTMILEIFKPQLTAYLVNRRVSKRYNSMIQIIDECIKNNDTKLFDFIEDFCKDKICILNRQPTLHRLGIQGFKIIPTLGNTIQIHPLVCVPYNSDFDGDAMAIYIPVEENAKKDIINKIMITNNILSPANGKVVTEPNQDIILGIYELTKKGDKEVEFTKKVYGKDRKLEEKTIKMSKGRVLFNECLPKNYPVIIDEHITKNKLMLILNRLAKKFPKEVLAECLDKIKSLGFNHSTNNGYTLSIFDFYNPKLKEIANSLSGKYEKDLKSIRENQELNNILKNMPFEIYIKSGARGSWAQAQQLSFARGYVADSKNKIRKELIRSSLVGGLTQKDFFHSCWGARKGLLDTALSTGDSGYLTRQLVYSTHLVELDVDIDDCQTKDMLELDVSIYIDKQLDITKTKQMIESLEGRYGHIYDEKNQTWSDEVRFKGKILDNDELVGKKIKIRSPIFCESKHICKKCYGDAYTIMNSNQIGIIATQTLGERLTQLVLRTFHLSGVATAADSKGGNEDIISGMTVINQYFHKPQNITDVNNPEIFLKKLFELFISYGSIYMVHFEVIVSAMIWVLEEDEIWRTSVNRKTKPKEWVSILKIPSKKSWLIGCAFNNLKSKILDGLVQEKKSDETIITSLFKL